MIYKHIYTNSVGDGGEFISHDIYSAAYIFK